MVMKYNGAIIIQGPSSNIPELKEAWDGFDLIWSTWKGDEDYYHENDIVVYNTNPFFGQVSCQVCNPT